MLWEATGAGGIAAETRRRRAESAVSRRGETVAHGLPDRWRRKVLTRDRGNRYSGATVLRQEQEASDDDGGQPGAKEALLGLERVGT